MAGSYRNPIGLREKQEILIIDFRVIRVITRQGHRVCVSLGHEADQVVISGHVIIRLRYQRGAGHICRIGIVDVVGEEAAGLTLSEIFELHGEAYYRAAGANDSDIAYLRRN